MDSIWHSFSTCFNYVFGVAVTALAVLVLRRVTRRWVRPRWGLWLWAILAFRVLWVGPLPTLPLSAQSVLPYMQPSPVQENQTTEAFKKDTLIGDFTAFPEMPTSEPAQPPMQLLLPGQQPIGVDYKKALLVGGGSVWALGALGLAAWFCLGHWSFLKKCKRLQPHQDSQAALLLAQAAKEVGCVAPQLLISQPKLGPVLVGITKPQLLLPPGYTEGEQRNIFLHELCHQKHGDNLLSLFAATTLCMHWFNPLMWLCWRGVRRDIELACDERVLQYTHDRKGYAALLLKAACGGSGGLVCGVSKNHRQVGERISRLAAFQKPKVWVSGIVAVSVLITAAFCLSGKAETIQPASGVSSSLQNQRLAQPQQPTLAENNPLPLSSVKECMLLGDLLAQGISVYQAGAMFTPERVLGYKSVVPQSITKDGVFTRRPADQEEIPLEVLAKQQPKRLYLWFTYSGLGAASAEEAQNKNEAFLSGYEALLGLLHETLPETQLVVLGLPPVADGQEDTATQTLHERGFSSERMQKVNEGLQQLCAKNEVEFISLWALFFDAEGNQITEYHATDGLHVSYQGYQRIEQFLLEGLLPTVAMPTLTGMTLREASLALQEVGLAAAKINSKNEGEAITRQYPTAGQQVPLDCEVILTCE